jgi:membrane-bound inhibitor of C-type lysozyme
MRRWMVNYRCTNMQAAVLLQLKYPYKTLSVFFLIASIFPISSNAVYKFTPPAWGNAALVCDNPRIGGDSPDLSFRGGSLDFETGYYHIGRFPNPENLYLGISKDEVTLLLQPSATHTPIPWLVTAVGAINYQISTCHHGQPRCITINADKQVHLGECALEFHGWQAWWVKSIPLGLGKWGKIMGSDGLGYMACLEVDPKTHRPVFEPCHTDNPDSTWRFEPVSENDAIETEQFKKLKATSSAMVNFPEGAEIRNYQCESGQSVETYYDSQQDQMWVRYQQTLLSLAPVVSASGAKFGGIDVPWGWWSKGDQNSIFAYDAKGNEGAFIERCVATAPMSDRTAPNTTSGNMNREWTASGEGEKIVVTDCGDCGDDIGMILECQGVSKPVLASIYWLANGVESQAVSASLVMIIDGQVFERAVSTTYLGQIGNVPQLELARNDPIFDALQTGSQAMVSFQGVNAQISLHGSKDALDKFKIHCGWRK